MKLSEHEGCQPRQYCGFRATELRLGLRCHTTLGLSGSQSQAINPILDFTNESPTDIVFESPNTSISNANPQDISPTTTATSTASTPIGGGAAGLTGTTGGDSTLLIVVIIGVAALLLVMKHKPKI